MTKPTQNYFNGNDFLGIVSDLIGKSQEQKKQNPWHEIRSRLYREQGRKKLIFFLVSAENFDLMGTATNERQKHGKQNQNLGCSLGRVCQA